MLSRVVLLLILVSVAVVAFQHTQFYRTLRIDDKEVFNVVTADDRSSGGRSQARVKFQDGKYRLECKIKKSDFAWPYCEIRFNYKSVDKVKLGIDLSKFTEVVIAARYRDENHNRLQGVRLQIRNFNPAYSKEEDEGTFKFNAIEYRFGDVQYPSLIPFDRMQVLSWWISELRIPVELQHIEMTDVRFIELATGNFMPEGDYIIDIDHITMRGKWISDEVAYLSVVLLWILSATLWLIISLISYRTNLRVMQRKQRELKIINQLLDSKSRELEDKAHRDALTKALNRAGLDHYLVSNSIVFTLEIELSLLYLDLDHFKQVNDVHGHDMGDRVLIEFARLVEFHTRETDLFVRWGGEEFVLLLPNTNIVSATKLAEKLRHQVAVYSWPNEMDITTSVGVAVKKPSEEITELFKRADGALYEAKHNGRNRVEIAD